MLQIKDVPSNFKDKGHLDMNAGRFGEAVRCFFENNCDLRIQEGSKKVSWWNNTLADLRDCVRKAWYKVKNTCNERCRRKAVEERKSLWKEYHKALTKARSNSWKQFCSSLEKGSEAN